MIYNTKRVDNKKVAKPDKKKEVKKADKGEK